MVDVGRCVGVVFTLGNSPPEPVSVFACVPPLAELTTVGGTSLSEEQPARAKPTARAAVPSARDGNKTIIPQHPSLPDTPAARGSLAFATAFNDLVPNPWRALL